MVCPKKRILTILSKEIEVSDSLFTKSPSYIEEKKESFREISMSQENLSNSAGPNCLKKKFWHAGGSDDYRRISDRRRLIYHRIQCCWKPRSRGDFCNFTRPLVSIYPARCTQKWACCAPVRRRHLSICILRAWKSSRRFSRLNFIISLVAVTGGEALAFSYYFKTLCLAFGLAKIPLSNVAVALIVTIGFIIANVFFGVRLTGRLQKRLYVFLLGCCCHLVSLP